MLTLWKRLPGLEKGSVLERVEVDEAGRVVAHVRPHRGRKLRCGRCHRPAAGYDEGEGRRLWRGLDLGTTMVFISGDAPRVGCRECGVTVAQVPWARHGARYTRHFEDTVAWLVTRTSKSTVAELMRVGWRTVGSIITRVGERGRGQAGGSRAPATLRKLGLSVPEEVGVVGFDDIGWSGYVAPPLTTVAQDKYGMGVKAAQMVDALLAGEDVRGTVRLEVTLVVRGSTAKRSP